MKLRATIEVALSKSNTGDTLEHDQRDLERTLPTTVVVKHVEYVPEPDDLRATLKKLLALKLEGVPEHFRKLSGYTKGDEEAPFFNEGFLYPLLGKDNARTVLARIKDLIRVAGFDPWELEQEVAAEQAAEEAEEKARLARRKKWQKEHPGKK